MKLSLFALALGTFAVGTAELVIAGILPLVAGDINVSVGTAGQLVTIYAIVFAVSGPLLTTLLARFERRSLLLAALIFFIIGTLFTILLADYGLIVLARVLAAAGSAVYSAIATAVAASIVPREKQGWAISVVVAGWSISSIVGAPLGTVLGQNFGWRASFVLVIGLSALAGIGLRMCLPKVAPVVAPGFKQQMAKLLQPALVLALVVSGLFLGGQFVIYTYLATFFKETAHLDDNLISLLMLVYGVAGTIGNMLGGYGADKLGVNRTLIVGVTVNVVALLALPVVGTSVIGAVAITAIWGLSSWSFTSAQQCRLLKLAPEAGGLVLSLNLSALNVGIAAGAGLGGAALGWGSTVDLAWLGGLVVAVGFALMLLSMALVARSKTAKASQGVVLEMVLSPVPSQD